MTGERMRKILLATLWIQIGCAIVLFQFVGPKSLNPAAIYGQF